MKLLAISTSGAFASAALITESGMFYTRSETGAGFHSKTILPLVDEITAKNDVELSDMDVFAADIGPGSFTGVRIGVCMINAMARAHKKLVVGISSLEAICRNDRGYAGKSICSLIDARNGNCYCAYYENGAPIIDCASMNIEELIIRLKEHGADKVTFLGDGAAAYKSELLSAFPGCAFIEGEAANSVNALSVAQTAAEKYDEFGADEVMPMYLRASQAERMYQQKHV